jgi:hypothetical protein
MTEILIIKDIIIIIKKFKNSIIYYLKIIINTIVSSNSFSHFNQIDLV